MTKFKRGKSEAEITHLLIKVNGVDFTPNEGDKFTELLGCAGKMSALPVLPKQISSPPFTVVFGEDDFLTLIKESGVHFKFEFADIDDLIQLIQDAVAKQLDLVKLSPQTRGDGYVPINHGEVFEGRD